MTKKYKVIFQPSGRRGEIEEGKTLLEAGAGPRRRHRGALRQQEGLRQVQGPDRGGLLREGQHPVRHGAPLAGDRDREEAHQARGRPRHPARLQRRDPRRRQGLRARALARRQAGRAQGRQGADDRARPGGQEVQRRADAADAPRHDGRRLRARAPVAGGELRPERADLRLPGAAQPAGRPARGRVERHGHRLDGQRDHQGRAGLRRAELRPRRRHRDHDLRRLPDRPRHRQGRHHRVDHEPPGALRRGRDVPHHLRHEQPRGARDDAEGDHRRPQRDHASASRRRSARRARTAPTSSTT